MIKIICVCICLMFAGLPGTYGYAAKMDPQTIPDEEHPAAGHKPEAAKINELLKEGQNYENSFRTAQAIRPYHRKL